MTGKGVLFDLDGVLIDSEGTYTGFWAGIDRRYPTGIANFAIAIKGTTLPEILKHFPDEEVQRQICRDLQAFQASMQFSLFPDTIDFIDRLHNAGIRCAIVTSSDSSKMERLYSQHPGFRERFEAIIDASQVTRSKPDPEGYLKGAAALGCDPADCYVFEDSIQGLLAARASGAKVVGVATTYPGERLTPLADVVINHLSEMSVERMLSL